MAMLVGGIAAAWIGAGLLSRIPKDRVLLVIASLLAAIAVLLLAETGFAGSIAVPLPPDQLLRAAAVALVAGTVVGAISSLLGVAGGEFIIPTLVLIFGADIKTAGTASVLISAPIVVSGVARHVLAGRFRSRTMLGFLVLPMSIGSILGAVIGGYVSASAPSDPLRVTLAAILLLSAIKLWRNSDGH